MRATRHLVLVLTLAALVAFPMGVTPVAAQTPPQVNGACTNTSAGEIVLAGTNKSFDMETPVGPLGFSEESIGSYVIDLRGLPVGAKKFVTVTLSWDNALADYDMNVNGTDYDSVDANEVAELGSLAHCTVVSGVAWNYIAGLPIDALSVNVGVAG